MSLILEDEKFLSDLFGQLRDAKTSEDRRKELVSEERILLFLTFHLFFVQVLFLKEFCQFSQTLQPQSRESFYKTLSNLGVLPGEPILLLTSMTVGIDNVGYLCSTCHARSRDHTAVASEGNEGGLCRHSPLHRRLLSLVGEALFAPPFPL